MPHLTLEYTNNLDLPADTNAVLLALHQVLQDVGGINIANCKSRLYPLAHFFIADNQRDEGFVHLDIVFVRGRSDAVKAQISQQCLDILKAAFLPMAQIPVQITVNVGDIPLEMYSKYPEGTLTVQ